MSKLINILGGKIEVLTSAEVVTWKASGLLDGDCVIDGEAGKIIYYNFDTDDFTEIDFGGGGGAVSYTKQYLNQSGAITDADLIGLSSVLGVWVDGSYYPFVVDDTPTPGVTVNIDTTTGDVDPGFTWDANNVVVQYSSTIPPSS